MNDGRNPRERLDALLSGLEEEVIRGEAGVTGDVGAMRAQMDALIEAHAQAAGRQAQRSPKAGDWKGKVASAVELLGRWAGIGETGGRRTAMPRVRMAFSGEREDAESGGPQSGSRRDGAQEEKEGGAK